eukprot:4397355-Amphidinium_carterae.1
MAQQQQRRLSFGALQPSSHLAKRQQPGRCLLWHAAHSKKLGRQCPQNPTYRGRGFNALST